MEALKMSENEKLMVMLEEIKTAADARQKEVEKIAEDHDKWQQKFLKLFSKKVLTTNKNNVNINI